MCPTVKPGFRAFADKEFANLKDPELLFNAIRQWHVDFDPDCAACDTKGLRQTVELIALRRLFDEAVQTAKQRSLPVPRARLYVRGHVISRHADSFKFLQIDGRYALVDEWLAAMPQLSLSQPLPQACNA